jgi:hypothetical protein
VRFWHFEEMHVVEPIVPEVLKPRGRMNFQEEKLQARFVIGSGA